MLDVTDRDKHSSFFQGRAITGVHWQRLLWLAALGEATQLGLAPFCVASPKVGLATEPGAWKSYIDGMLILDAKPVAV